MLLGGPYATWRVRSPGTLHKLMVWWEIAGRKLQVKRLINTPNLTPSRLEHQKFINPPCSKPPRLKQVTVYLPIGAETQPVGHTRFVSPHFETGESFFICDHIKIFDVTFGYNECLYSTCDFQVLIH